MDVFKHRPSRLSIKERTIKGDKSFETREEALKDSRILLQQIRGTEQWAAVLKQKATPKATRKKVE